MLEIREDNFDEFEKSVIDNARVIQREKSDELLRNMHRRVPKDTGLMDSLLEKKESPDALADTGLDILVGVFDPRRADVAFFTEVGTSRQRGQGWMAQSMNDTARGE